jgi:hypothetical protein
VLMQRVDDLYEIRVCSAPLQSDAAVAKL